MPVEISKKKKEEQPKVSPPTEKHSVKVGDDELKTAVGMMVKTHQDGTEEKEVEKVAVVTGKGPFANVGYSVSRGVRIAEFENVKIEVSLHAPAEMTDTDIDNTFEFAQSWVDGKMNEIVAQIEAAKAE